MKQRKVIFLSLPSTIFGNGGQTWLSIDLTETKTALKNRGFMVYESAIDKAWDIELCQDDIVVYSSCEATEIREYMKDTFYFLRDRCILLPDYDFLLAYENKGFQELKKKALNIGNLSGAYHYDLDDTKQDIPYVFKTIGGAGSSGVHLVRNSLDLQRLKRKFFSISLKRKAIMQQRKRVLSSLQFAAYRYRHKGFRRHVIQDFIPGVDHDYKILVFGDRFFGLKRNVRKGDFRASGSGDFDFSERIPDNVLTFAAEISESLDAPQLSLDVVLSPKGCHLIEYQALNFGPMTLTKSEGFYKKSEENTWDWIEGQSDLGQCFAHSLCTYFDRKGITCTSSLGTRNN